MAKKLPSKPPAEPYEPTPSELSAIDDQRTRRRKRKPSPSLSETGVSEAREIGIDHPDHRTGQILLMEALGTGDSDFLSSFIGQLANAATHGKDVDLMAINFMLSVVKDIEPRDQLEAMLAAQMAAVHNATMTFARRLNNVDNIKQQDSAERAFNKLARTFAAQVEALKRYRTGGEQKVTVQHVNVSEGGQAIVGNVSPGGGEKEK